MSSKFWQRLTIKIPKNNLDIVSSRLDENGSIGIEELSDKDGKITLKAYFEKSISIDIIINELRNKFNAEIEVGTQEYQDWNAEWRKSILPLRLTDRFWVKASWNEFSAPQGNDVLIIDPKMTFGTGHHETTRICSRLIESVPPGGPFLDAGTGTGILAILASKIGWGPVTAFDIDPMIAENTVENFQQNGVQAARLFAGPVNALQEHVRFGLVAANMIRTHLYEIMDSLIGHVEVNGYLVLSGLLLPESEEMKDRIQDRGFILISEVCEGEWWGGCWKRK